MKLNNFLPEVFTIKKYVKVKGIVQYQTVQTNITPQIIEKCESLIWMIRTAQYFEHSYLYVNIASTRLKSILGNNYHSIIELLSSYNLIIYNQKFSTQKHFSKSFAIHKDSGWIFDEYNKGLYQRSYRHETNLEGCTEDRGCTKGSVSSDKQNNEVYPITYSICGTTGVFGTTFLNEYIVKTLHQSASLVQPRLSVSAKCCRIFTSINMMPKSERSKMVDSTGKPYITIDFKTSHLQHLLKLINTSTGINKEELNRFKIAVLEGDFYNSLNNRYTREKNKKYVCCWLASSRKNWKGVQTLKALYPSISSFIDTFNKGTRNLLMNELMQSESNLINNTVLAYIAQHRPSLTAYSIHDAIMCAADDIEYLKGLIDDLGTTFLGFKPRYTMDRPAVKPVKEEVQPAALPTVQPVLEKSTVNIQDEINEMMWANLLECL